MSCWWSRPRAWPAPSSRTCPRGRSLPARVAMPVYAPGTGLPVDAVIIAPTSSSQLVTNRRFPFRFAEPGGPPLACGPRRTCHAVLPHEPAGSRLRGVTPPVPLHERTPPLRTAAGGRCRACSLPPLRFLLAPRSTCNRSCFVDSGRAGSRPFGQAARGVDASPSTASSPVRSRAAPAEGSGAACVCFLVLPTSASRGSCRSALDSPRPLGTSVPHCPLCSLCSGVAGLGRGVPGAGSLCRVHNARLQRPGFRIRKYRPKLGTCTVIRSRSAVPKCRGPRSAPV